MIRNIFSVPDSARLEFQDEVVNATVEGFGDANQSRKRNVLFATFDPSEIIRVQFGSLSQVLQRQFPASPVLADGPSENDPMVAGC